MGKQRRAVVDIGTNSTKLLVADVEGPTVDPLLEESSQTRLGEGFYETHRLQPEPIQRTAAAVAKFLQKARENGAEILRAVATSAARDAENPEDLRHAVRERCGINIEIISGEAEAEYAFRGVTLTPDLQRRPVCLLEVGGGSTQVIVGHGDHPRFLQSYRMGTVRMLERVPHSDPPKPAELEASRAWIRNFIREQMQPGLRPALVSEAPHLGAQGVQLVGTGGTSTILGRIDAGLETYDRERLDNTCIDTGRLKLQAEKLWSLPLTERKKVKGLPANRADVILMGLLIFEAMMVEFSFDDLRISTRGLRFGLLLDPPSRAVGGRGGQGTLDGEGL